MEDYCTYEQSVALKELGFDWRCYTWYHWDSWFGLTRSGMYENHNMFEKSISAPTLAQAQKWLRDVKDLILCVGFDSQYYWYLCQSDGTVIDGDDEISTYQTYESALSEGINRAIKILTDNTEKI